MSKIVCLCLGVLCFISGFADNNYNVKTGEYYLSEDDSFHPVGDKNSNEFIDRDNASVFMGNTDDTKGIEIADDLVLDTYASSTNLALK